MKPIVGRDQDDCPANMTDLYPGAPTGVAALGDSGPTPRGRVRAPFLGIRSLAFAGLMLAAIAHPVCAQTSNDYYRAQSDKALTNLLQQVEKYHLIQSISGLRPGQYPPAHADLAFVLRYFPNHPQALLLMSELCVKWKQPAQCNADEYLQNAIRLNPEAADTYTIQGIYLQNTGRLDQAIESYKKALALNPTSRNAHYNLGLAYVNKKDFVHANEHAQQAYSLGMTLPGLRNMLTKAGAWKPLPAEPQAPPAAAAAPENAPSESGPAAK